MKQVYEYRTKTDYAACCLATADRCFDKRHIYSPCLLSVVSPCTGTAYGAFVSQCLVHVLYCNHMLASICHWHSCRGMLPRVWGILASQFRYTAVGLLSFARIFCLHRFAWIGIRYIRSFRLQGCSRTRMVRTGILRFLVSDRTWHHLVRNPVTRLASVAFLHPPAHIPDSPRPCRVFSRARRTDVAPNTSREETTCPNL